MSAEYPTPWVAGLHRFQAGATNPNGSPAKVWLPAKDVTGQGVRIIGWAALGAAYEPEHNRNVLKAEVYLTPQLRDLDGEPVDDPGVMDLIDLPGAGQWEIQGLRDYTHGFHNWSAGKVLDVQRTTG